MKFSSLLDTLQKHGPHLQDMVPGRSSSRVYMEICVAVLHTDQAVFGDFWFSQKSIIRPIVFHPGQLLNYIWRLYKTGHPLQRKLKTNVSTRTLIEQKAECDSNAGTAILACQWDCSAFRKGLKSLFTDRDLRLLKSDNLATIL